MSQKLFVKLVPNIANLFLKLLRSYFQFFVMQKKKKKKTSVILLYHYKKLFNITIPHSF